MIAGRFLGYLEATFLAFLVNVIPAFAPPTWIVLSLYKINNPQFNSVALAFFRRYRVCFWKICHVSLFKVAGQVYPSEVFGQS